MRNIKIPVRRSNLNTSNTKQKSLKEKLAPKDRWLKFSKKELDILQECLSICEKDRSCSSPRIARRLLREIDLITGVD